MKEVIQQYRNHIVDDKTQKMLNLPEADQTGFNEGYEEFLSQLIDKLGSGKIDPYVANTLYNNEVYSKLNEEDQEKADLTALNIIAIIRQVEQLWKMNQKPTHQIQNLVESIFQMKSKFEKEYGDVYII